MWFCGIVYLLMPKKRRTRQQKKILKLKRELERVRKKTKRKPASALETSHRRMPPRSVRDAAAGKAKKPLKREKISFQPEYDEKLIKKDLLKTLLLSLFFLALIFVLYLQPSILNQGLSIFKK